MKLLLDFGNTRVKVAVRDGDDLRQIYCGPVLLDNLSKAVEGLEIDGGMWCSVHPLELSVLAWMSSLGLSALTAATPIPIGNDYSSPATLGMDRLAAAVGAWSIGAGKDLLVIDAGTAITYDFVSASGVYKGGNIAPGKDLRFKALHEHTGALPLVGYNGVVPMLGNDTETAIRSGVMNGIRYEIEGYMEELGSLFPSLLVFLTGGDAESFDIKAKRSIFALPDLVLRGLARIVEYNERGF